jgi:hypothetical protein
MVKVLFMIDRVILGLGTHIFRETLSLDPRNELNAKARLAAAGRFYHTGLLTQPVSPPFQQHACHAGWPRRPVLEDFRIGANPFRGFGLS